MKMLKQLIKDAAVEGVGEGYETCDPDEKDS